MLIRQMRKSIDHVQEILLRQYTANVLGIYTIPATCRTATVNDGLSLALPPEQFFHHPAATIYRSIPNEQIYFPYYFKQPFHFPFYTSSFFDYHRTGLDPENQLKLYNANQANRAGTLLTNENYKLININNFHWPDGSNSAGFPNSLPPTGSPSSNLNGARQFASSYVLPPYKDPNLGDPYFDKLRLDNRALTNQLTNQLNYQHASSKFLPLKQPLSQQPFRENGRCFRPARSTYQLPKRENQSRTTNYSNSIITNGSSLLTDGLGSRLAELESHQCSPCLPVYTSDLIGGSPNHQYPFAQPGFQTNGQPPFLHGQLLHHYLLNCQLQNLDRQQHQYYDNVFTSAFYDSDTNASKTDQCLTIHNLLCSFEVSVCMQPCR